MTRYAWEKDLARFLREDRASQDVTSRAILPPRVEARGELIAQAPGVASGLRAAALLARRAGLKAQEGARDGDRVRRGDVVLTLVGPARRMLAVERTIVNLVMHLSGIATQTSLVVARARAVRPGFRIAATRKTLPGLRDLEKEAVVHGGGESHRRDLASALLVKGNHQRVAGFDRALRLAHRTAERRGLELMVEVGNPEEAVEAVRGGSHRILVDNRTPREVRAILSALAAEDLRKRTVVEVTGGITAANVAAYARTGADLASSGTLTHSAPALPFHLVVRPLGTIMKGAYEHR